MMQRYQQILTDLCAPYACLKMYRRTNGCRFATLVIHSEEFPDKKLGYDTLVKWVDLGWLVRVLAPFEKYEITREGRDVAAQFQPAEPEAPRYKWLRYSEEARRALGK